MCEINENLRRQYQQITHGVSAMREVIRSSTHLAVLLIATTAQAQNVLTMSERLEQRNVDFGTIEIIVETVAPGLHVLFGLDGNIAASIGDQGVLIVDDQYPAMVPKIQRAVQQLGGGDVDFVINTHWHFDHTSGNPILGESGSWIVSHANSRDRMTRSQILNQGTTHIKQPAVPAEGLPVITFEDGMQFHFNGERIDLLYLGPAHTTGDAVVIFRGHNVVHMGDIFFNQRYPYIDAGSGGDIDGVIRSCETILAQIDLDTVVIPGHGPVASYSDLQDYVSMLRTIRERIAGMIADGATLDDIIAANPTAEWDAEMGDPSLLLDRAFASLTR
jgi:glyoxylase-like metal-dependent hydrolase (beta-lactamase superfamily II)